MDLKVLLLCIVKALWEVFLTPPATQEQWEQFQVGWCGFFGTVFPEILVRHCLPSTETPHTSTASSSINAVEEEPIEITPNFTPHQDWTHPKLPQRMGISSLDVLLHWRNNLGRVSAPRFCLSGAKCAELKAWSFSGPRGSQEAGCRFPIPNSFLKFNSSLFFFTSLFPLQLCDILLFRKPLMNPWLDISNNFLQEQYWRELQICGMGKSDGDFFNNNSSRKTNMWVGTQCRVLKAHTLHLSCPSI